MKPEPRNGTTTTVLTTAPSAAERLILPIYFCLSYHLGYLRQPFPLNNRHNPKILSFNVTAFRTMVCNLPCRDARSILCRLPGDSSTPRKRTRPIWIGLVLYRPIRIGLSPELAAKCRAGGLP